MNTFNHRVRLDESDKRELAILLKANDWLRENEMLPYVEYFVDFDGYHNEPPFLDYYFTTQENAVLFAISFFENLIIT